MDSWEINHGFAMSALDVISVILFIIILFFIGFLISGGNNDNHPKF